MEQLVRNPCTLNALFMANHSENFAFSSYNHGGKEAEMNLAIHARASYRNDSTLARCRYGSKGAVAERYRVY